MDFALNNLQRLICHKTETNKQTNKHGYFEDTFFSFDSSYKILSDLKFILTESTLYSS